MDHEYMLSKRHPVLKWILFSGITVIYLLSCRPFLDSIFGSRQYPPPKIESGSSENMSRTYWALDVKLSTRWSTNRPQRGDEWILLDLGEKQRIEDITLDNTYSRYDFPRDVGLELSLDNINYLETNYIRENIGHQSFLRFVVPQAARFIRISQTGQSNRFRWSIDEISITSKRLVEPLSTIRRIGILFGILIMPVGILFCLIYSGFFEMLYRRFNPGHVLQLCVFILFILMIFSYLFSKESIWGLSWIGNFSLAPRLCAFFLIGICFYPRANKLIQKFVNVMINIRFLQNISIIKQALLIILLFALSWILRSQTIYGDGYGTITLLNSGQIMNWKEPLDRLFTALTYIISNKYLGFSPGSAIALMSCLAGVVFWISALLIAKLIGHTREDKFYAFVMVISIGAVQLFFGNIENYSLLGAFSLLYLLLAHLYLDRKISLVFPAFVLSTTISMHLSAIWLAPSLAFLPLLREMSDIRVEIKDWRECLIRNLRYYLAEIRTPVIVSLIPLLLTLILGNILIGTSKDLNISNFGGGDGSLWVPLFRLSTPYEKFTLFSFDHLLAIMNEMILICAVGLIATLSYIIFQKKRKVFDNKVYFLLVSALFFFAYLFFFNPDLAYLNVGVLNEWDLLSPVAFPLIYLGLYLLFNWEKDLSVRRSACILLIAFGIVHSFSWILSNAKIVF